MCLLRTYGSSCRSSRRRARRLGSCRPGRRRQASAGVGHRGRQQWGAQAGHVGGDDMGGCSGCAEATGQAGQRARGGRGPEGSAGRLEPPGRASCTSGSCSRAMGSAWRTCMHLAMSSACSARSFACVCALLPCLRTSLCTYRALLQIFSGSSQAFRPKCSICRSDSTSTSCAAYCRPRRYTCGQPWACCTTQLHGMGVRTLQ